MLVPCRIRAPFFENTISENCVSSIMSMNCSKWALGHREGRLMDSHWLARSPPAGCNHDCICVEFHWATKQGLEEVLITNMVWES